jgi:hypothetical protein
MSDFRLVKPATMQIGVLRVLQNIKDLRALAGRAGRRARERDLYVHYNV